MFERASAHQGDWLPVFPEPRVLYEGDVLYQDRTNLLPPTQDGRAIRADLYKQMGLEKYAEWHIREHYSRLYFEKHSDWDGEREYRWVLPFGRGEDVYFRYGDSLRGIVFGANTPEKTIAKVIRQSEGQGLWLQRLEWKLGILMYSASRDFTVAESNRSCKTASSGPSSRVRVHPRRTCYIAANSFIACDNAGSPSDRPAAGAD